MIQRRTGQTFLVAGLSILLGSLILTSVGYAQVPNCSTLFADSSKVSTVLEQAKFVVNGLPTTAVAAQSRLALIEKLGAKDALALFGSDFNQWPMFLGQSFGGHIVLASPRKDGGEIMLLVYKQLEISSTEFIRRRDLDTEIALGNVSAPAKYESIQTWLERTESSFNQVKLDFSRDAKLWVIQDYNHNQLAHAVLTDAGAFGKFSQPWLIRSTSVATPEADGKSARVSEPNEIEPLVQRLLKMELVR